MKNIVTILSVLMTTMLISGCMHCRSKEGETMRPLASALEHLSPQVENVVRYETPPANATDEELLKLATKGDPGLLDSFKGYKLRIHSQDRHAIVLLCNEDGKRGLLEDLGCTGTLDRNLWKEDAAMPCEFSLSVELGCRLRK